jgi:hypothetical protein
MEVVIFGESDSEWRVWIMCDEVEHALPSPTLAIPCSFFNYKSDVIPQCRAFSACA